MRQDVRFCTSPDGVRLAYGVHGSGPPLVRVATWLTHLASDWSSPVWRHWLARLGERHTVIRYDERGCGLSDARIGELSVETWVADLETVVDAAGVDKFTLLGMSQGAAIAVVYAARHPERVVDLVLYGGYARGRNHRGQQREEQALLAAIEAGWTARNPAFRRMFSMLFLPSGTPEQMAWFEDLLSSTTSAATAVRLFEARGEIDVACYAPQVRARTLVAHARDDRVVPVDEATLLAGLIPGARLCLLDSENHILLAEEPAWEQFSAELGAFVGGDEVPGSATGVSDLTARELEVVELVAAGLANDEIADRLHVSVRTVERHLSNIYAKLHVRGKVGRAAAATHFARLRNYQ